jgi:hypothetical protein
MPALHSRRQRKRQRAHRLRAGDNVLSTWLDGGSHDFTPSHLVTLQTLFIMLVPHVA